MKKHKDFYAALALFKSLYKSEKGDIYTIIKRFILAGVKLENLLAFNVTDVERILEKHFSIVVPKSVIITCLRNQETFGYKHEAYHVARMDAETESLLEELRMINEQNDDIISELYEFIEHKNLIDLNDNQKEEIRGLFFDFVEDRDTSSTHPYFQDVMHFIIDKEADTAVQESLNAIKEGTIIYRGIKYSETSNAKTWKNDTIFFLGMEYLFGAFGLNGTFYQEFFSIFIIWYRKSMTVVLSIIMYLAYS